MTPSEKALYYAYDVVNGDIVAGKYTVLACQRFIDDLQKDWEFTYSKEAANRAVRFIEKLPHVKGEWAAKKKLLTLEPWQCFAECNIFGWLREDGTRRFGESYEEVARKNGKSVRVGGRGLYMFCADGEYGAEVYSGATSERQAYEIFRPAKRMVERSKLKAHTHGDRGQYSEHEHCRNPFTV